MINIHRGKISHINRLRLQLSHVFHDRVLFLSIGPIVPLLLLNDFGVLELGPNGTSVLYSLPDGRQSTGILIGIFRERDKKMID